MRLRWLARYILPRMKDWAAARHPDFQVIKDDGEIYLNRWFVRKNTGKGGIYLHQMLKDDDAVLHDHPYSSISLVLTDGLKEIYCDEPRTINTSVSGPIPMTAFGGISRVRFPQEGDLIFRSSRMAHQLVVLKPAWTLFFTGPRVREWGFWCPKGWIPWTRYVDARFGPGGKGTGTSGKGPGCGEMS